MYPSSDQSKQLPVVRSGSSDSVPPGGDQSTTHPPTVQDRGGPPALRILIAWVLIALFAVAWVRESSARHAMADQSATSRVSTANELGGRIVHNLMELVRTSPDRASLAQTAIESANPGEEATWIDKVGYAILQADVLTPADGRQALERLGVPEGASAADGDLYRAVLDALQKRERNEPPASLPEQDAERLGWFARLLVGDAPSSNIAVFLVGVVIWYVGFVCLGLVALVLLLVFVLLGKIRSRVSILGPTPGADGRGAVYVETFALWFFLFLGLQLGLAKLLVLFQLQHLMLIGALVSMFGSLGALGWPLLRGVAWQDVRQDIGLHAGRGVLVEAAFGPLTYAVALPFMGAGLILYSLLRKIFESGAQPSHPVVDQLGGGVEAVLPVFLLACVAAPIVEEIAFRGILYRHLRASGRFVGTVASAVLATLVSGALFAGIHPQGLLFIPVLGGLATGFCLAREFRGSLIPCIVAHSINNFVTVTLGVVLSQG
jgi:membrane protease YdiL (CAAX protease family)